MPEFHSRFEERDLVEKDNLVSVIAAIGEVSVTIAQLEDWAERRWFSWRRIPDLDGAFRLGVPSYIAERLILFRTLVEEGWTDRELTAYAEYEDDFVDGILLSDRIPMPAVSDDGLASATALIQDELRCLEDELGARRPRELWPDGWMWRSRSSELMELPTEKLEAQATRVGNLLGALESNGWAGIKPDTAERVRRHAFMRAMWEETVGVVMLEKERLPLRAGISWFLALADMPEESEPLNVPEPATYAASFRFRWDKVIESPWTDDDDRDLPVRLPGLLLQDGHVTLTDQANPSSYANLYDRWDLGAYKQLHARRLGNRTCGHCHGKITDGPLSKAYCSRACGLAARQARSRERKARPTPPGPSSLQGS